MHSQRDAGNDETLEGVVKGRNKPMIDELTFSFTPREEQQSDYDWMNIEFGDVRVGKVRAQIDGKRLTVFSINVFEAYQGRGYARKVIEKFKSSYFTIIADRVRPNAREFWGKMGFEENHDGNWMWRKVKGRVVSGK